MYKAKFNYNGQTTFIQCKKEDSLLEICKKYTDKTENDIRKLIFICKGNSLDFEKKFGEMINKANEDMNELNILVFDNVYADDEEGKIIKSKDVICPKCGELCLINFD